MDFLDKNLIILLALEFNPEDIINFCLTSKRYNESICKNSIFWMNKLYNEYPDIQMSLKGMRNVDYKKIYLSLMRKEKVYYCIDLEGGGKIRDYLKKHKEFKEVKYKIRRINKSDKEICENVFYTLGDFPSETKIWLTNGRGFLSLEEAMEEFENHNYIKQYLNDDYINHRQEFIDEKGVTPEEYYKMTYEEAYTFYKKKLLRDSNIVHPSYEDCCDSYILKELYLP